MKKTLLCFAAAMLMMALPTGRTQAQTVQREVRIDSLAFLLDRASVESARIYATTDLATTYYADGLASPAEGTVAVSTLTEFTDLERNADGTFSVNVDSLAYANAFVLVSDNNGVNYVLGTLDADSAAMGYFRPAQLFANPSEVVATAPTALMGLGATLRDNQGYAYSTFAKADQLSMADTIRFTTGLAATDTATLTRAMVYDLGNQAILGTIVLNNSADTLVIKADKGATIANLVGSVSEIGVVSLQLDTMVVDSMSTGSHTIVVNGAGIFRTINGPAISPAILYGGQFNTLEGFVILMGGEYATRYDNMMAYRHAFLPNEGSTTYPWKVVEGFAVRYTNHDAEGLDHDTIIVYNNSTNRIEPRYNGTHAGSTDTILLNWYTTPTLDPESRWSHAEDVLTSDTTLYPHWLIRNSATQLSYKVVYLRQNANNDYYTAIDSVYGFAEPGDPLTVAPNMWMRGCHLIDDTISIASFNIASGTDTTFYYHFDRNVYTIHWMLNGGTMTNMPDSLYRYQQLIVYPTEQPVRPGHDFIGWTPTPTQMPNNDFPCTAIYEARICNVTWNGSGNQTYTAQPAVLSATFSDQGTDYDATLNYYLDGQRVSDAVKVGNYLVVATSDDENFHLDPATSTFTLVISPATLTVSGTDVDKRKTYDGTDVANVTNPGTVAALGSDDVTVSTTARFDNAAAGTGKSIIATYTLGGADVANYTLAATTATIFTDGEILPLINIDESVATQGFDIDAFGYCAGDNAGITYHLTSGTPTEYKLTFADDDITNQGFANVDWTAVNASSTGDGQIDIPVSATAASGIYSVQLKFRNELGDSTSAITVSFGVRLNKDFARPLFTDVIAVVDTCHCLSNIQWYEDGNAIAGATGYYYQHLGGLTGHTYHFTATYTQPDGTTRITATCEQDNITDYVEETPATVSVYPNPTVDMATVSIEGGQGGSHSIRLFNAMGVQLLNATFEGDSYSLSLAGMGRGTYTLSVDGQPVRVIKK